MTSINDQLRKAAEKGDISSAIEAISNKADINCLNHRGETPLHLASRYGHFSVVKLLVENKAEINIKNDNSDTPLHWATFFGYVDIVQHLIENGADIDLKNVAGKTATDITPKTTNHDAIQLVMQYKKCQLEKECLNTEIKNQDYRKGIEF